MFDLYCLKFSATATGVSVVDERPARRAGLRRRMSCPATPRMHGWFRMPHLAWLPELLVILGVRTDRRMSLQPPVGHATLLATRQRRWEATMLRSRVTELHFNYTRNEFGLYYLVWDT